MTYCDACCEMAPCLECEDLIEQLNLKEWQEANDEALAMVQAELAQTRQPLPIASDDECPW